MQVRVLQKILTTLGKRYSTPIPNSRPHAAPVSRRGIKTPEGTLRPKVQRDRKKYSVAKIRRVMGRKESEICINFERLKNASKEARNLRKLC